MLPSRSRQSEPRRRVHPARDPRSARARTNSFEMVRLARQDLPLPTRGGPSTAGACRIVGPSCPPRARRTNADTKRNEPPHPLPPCPKHQRVCEGLGVLWLIRPCTLGRTRPLSVEAPVGPDALRATDELGTPQREPAFRPICPQRRGRTGLGRAGEAACRWVLSSSRGALILPICLAGCGSSSWLIGFPKRTGIFRSAPLVRARASLWPH